MAKRSESTRARRASLRTQLKDATYTQIKSMLESGKLSESDIRLYYSDIRADMQRQIKRIDKSDVKFITVLTIHRARAILKIFWTWQKRQRTQINLYAIRVCQLLRGGGRFGRKA